jgi:hypothetical protein
MRKTLRTETSIGIRGVGLDPQFAGRRIACAVVRVAPIKPGDIVEVDKKGRKVHGLVLAVERDGSVRFEPLCKGVSWRSARPREVVRHWTRGQRLRGAADPDVNEGQLDLDV